MPPSDILEKTETARTIMFMKFLLSISGKVQLPAHGATFQPLRLIPNALHDPETVFTTRAEISVISAASLLDEAQE